MESRGKLDAILSDYEVNQLSCVYDSLEFNRSLPVKLEDLRKLLLSAVVELRTRGTLLPSLWEDMHELNSRLERSVLKRPDQALLVDKQTFFHMWKSYGSTKRLANLASSHSSCNELIILDQQRWKLHKAEKKLHSAKVD
jgi:hypothetical protein